MGNFMSSLFGGQAQSVEMPAADPLPTGEETKEPVARNVRDTERRRVLARRSQTILTSPLGTGQNSILGRPM